MLWESAQAMTVLGDSLVLMPASVVFVAVLIRRGKHALASAWMNTLFAGLAALWVVKIVGVIFARASGTALVSVSGHAGLAALFYPSVVLVVIASRSVGGWVSNRRMILNGLWVVVAALVVAIALSRVELSAHTPIEIVLGTILGLSFAAGFARSGRAAVALPSRWVLWGQVAVVAGLAVGRVAVEFSGTNLEEHTQATATILIRMVARVW